ncbi:hypothetical protein MOO46_06225 [Apilactobacillus apisilvae]|uniref:Exopolyphosphatase n=1 Tax=Apilactobacillus apisilvae TaxID=2923364 RepID=A0ABY4PG94_9LACO|nr:hypothetical protein [Apilactobacillus apisilvae]UQS84836.1 hypothetical protein MOO46_06225 [Apilactobacillus apisilvae]
MPNDFSSIIVMGSQNIFVQIIDIKHSKLIEDTHYDIDLGEDVFSDRIIEGQTVNEIVDSLNVVRNLLNDYQINDYKFFATNAFHEARNSELVKDQLEQRTGFNINWISQSQESLYRNIATNFYLTDFKKITQNNTLLMDISSGNIELMGYQNSKFTYSKTLNLGPLRVYEVMSDFKADIYNFNEVLHDYIDGQLFEFVRGLPDIGSTQNVILLGSSTAILKALLGNYEITSKLTMKDLDDLYHKMRHVNDQELINLYNIDENSLHQVIPLVTLIHELLESLDVKNIWVSNLKFIDGLTCEKLENSADDNKIEKMMNNQIITSARNMAKQYNVEPKHQMFVEDLSLKLFDELKDVHGLNGRQRLLLQLASIVDDVGSFINNYNHYAHSEYIIKNSEILGLSNIELIMVAMISRYHSHRATSSMFKMLDDLSIEHRMTVIKLSALLRISDALDASRLQKIRTIDIKIVNTTELMIYVTTADELTLEKLNLARKGAFFESVFGIKPILKGEIRQ